jgi:hypothetical protein
MLSISTRDIIDHGGLFFFFFFIRSIISAAASSLPQFPRETTAERFRQPSGESLEEGWNQRLYRQKRNQR